MGALTRPAAPVRPPGSRKCSGCVAVVPWRGEFLALRPNYFPCLPNDSIAFLGKRVLQGGLFSLNERADNPLLNRVYFDRKEPTSREHVRLADQTQQAANEPTNGTRRACLLKLAAVGDDHRL